MCAAVTAGLYYCARPDIYIPPHCRLLPDVGKSMLIVLMFTVAPIKDSHRRLNVPSGLDIARWMRAQCTWHRRLYRGSAGAKKMLFARMYTHTQVRSRSGRREWRDIHTGVELSHRLVSHCKGTTNGMRRIATFKFIYVLKRLGFIFSKLSIVTQVYRVSRGVSIYRRSTGLLGDGSLQRPAGNWQLRLSPRQCKTAPSLLPCLLHSSDFMCQNPSSWEVLLYQNHNNKVPLVTGARVRPNCGST